METNVTLYKNHGKTIGFWNIAIGGGDDTTCTLLIQHAKSMDSKPITSSVTVKGKNIGRANETTPSGQALKELQSRVKKQIDKGYVRTMEEAKAPATNALGLTRPMLAERWDKCVDKLTTEELESAFIQPKLDGNRMLAQHGVAWTRGGQERTTVDHILKEIKEAGLEGFGLDGELYIHGVRLQDINSLVKKFRPSQHPILPDEITGHLPPELVVQLGTEDLEFHVYDIFGTDLGYDERAELLAKYLPSDLPHVKFVHTYTLRSTLEENSSRDAVLAVISGWHSSFIAKGYEGAIVRLADGVYESKRSRALIKVKEFVDSEFEVIGVEERQGRKVPYTPKLHDFVLSTYGMDIDQITEEGTVNLRSGVWVCKTPEGKTFNTTIHGDMWEKHKLFTEALEGHRLGRQLTIRYIYMSTDGIPQIPVALQFREDD